MPKSFRSNVPFLLVLLCMIVLLAACQQEPWVPGLPAAPMAATTTACTIKIGVVNSPGLVQGQELQKGYEMARDEINAAGGVSGCRLELISEDDQNDPLKATAAAQKLIEKDQVALLVGSFSSPCSLAVAEQAEINQVPFLIPNSTSSLLTQKGYRYTFRLPADSTAIIKSAFAFLDDETAEETPLSVSILYESNLSGSSLASAFLSLAADNGWSVLNYLKFNSKIPENEQNQQMRAVLDPISNTLPDVLFITADSEDTLSLLLESIRQRRISPKAIIGLGGAFDNVDFLEKNLSAAEQMIVVNQWSPEIVWGDGLETARDEFMAAFSDLYHAAPGNRSVQAYTSIYIAKNALSYAFAQNPVKIRAFSHKALQIYNQTEPLFGQIQFNANGQNQHAPILTQVLQGENRVVFPAEYKTTQAQYPMRRMAEQIDSPQGTEPAVLRIGMQQTISHFNPIWSSLDSERSFFRQIYDTLYEIGSSGVYIPLLAQEAIRSEDGKTFRFTLPTTAKFHDGIPLTANDVVFSFRLYASTKDSVRANDLSQMEYVFAEDNYTVVMTFKEPVSDIADRLSQLYVLPEHIWKPYSKNTSTLKSFSNIPPIGSGAFIYQKHTPGVSIEMQANKNHWKRPPLIDGMVWNIYTDQDKMIDDLQYSDIDAISALSPSAANRIKNIPGIQVVSGTPLRPDFLDIIINQIDPRKCPPGGKCSGHPALRDLQVRKALAAATDKERIIRVAVSGMAVPGLTLVPTSLEKWPNTSLKDIPFDLDNANQILDEAGYADLDNDGIRQTPDGKLPLVFRIYYPANDAKFLYQRPAELLNESWNRIGIALKLVPVEESRLVDLVNPGFDHDIVLWGWSVNPNPDFILSIPTTRQILGGNSETGYSNPEYDLLYEQQASEEDPFKRLSLVWKMQEIIFDDVVYIIPYENQNTCAVRTDRFQGWALNPKKLMLELPSTLSQLEAVR